MHLLNKSAPLGQSASEHHKLYHWPLTIKILTSVQLQNFSTFTNAVQTLINSSYMTAQARESVHLCLHMHLSFLELSYQNNTSTIAIEANYCYINSQADTCVRCDRSLSKYCELGHGLRVKLILVSQVQAHSTHSAPAWGPSASVVLLQNYFVHLHLMTY